MAITYETAEFMLRFLCYALDTCFDMDWDDEELQEAIGNMFDDFCNDMGIVEIEQPNSLEDALTLFYTGTF